MRQFHGQSMMTTKRPVVAPLAMVSDSAAQAAVAQAAGILAASWPWEDFQQRGARQALKVSSQLAIQTRAQRARHLVLASVDGVALQMAAAGRACVRWNR